MYKLFCNFMILILAQTLFAQSLYKWEDCTKGLEGVSRNVLIYSYENVLYLRSQLNTFYSTNLGINWKPFKRYDSNFKCLTYLSISFINKYKNIYILTNDFGHYISNDKQNWQKLKFELPDLPSNNVMTDNINLITTDSTIILRVVWCEKIDSTKYLEHKRTCIAKGIGNDISETYKFDTLSEENDYITTEQEKYFTYLNIDGIVYSIYYTLQGRYFSYYYFSTDNGESWRKKEISNIEGGIKTLVKINGKLWIISPFALWRPKDDGTYEKVEDEQFDSFNTDFLSEHKGMIYAQAIDSSNHKSILVRSISNGLTWEKVGNQYFKIKQLFSINGELIIKSSKGIMASTDDGESWEEREQGLFQSPNYNDEGPWKKIIQVGENECITAPRNGMNNVMMKSYDGGKTWEHKYVIDSIGYTEYDWTGELYNFTFSSNKYGLFAVDRGSNKTYKSYDKGETWEIYSNVAAFYKDEDKNMYERNDTLLYFYDDPYFPNDKFIYYSLDTGKTFVIYDSLYLQKLPEKSEHLFVKNGQYFAIDNENTIYNSTNEGKNWDIFTKIILPVKDSLYKVFYYDVTSDKPILVFGYKDNPNYPSFTQKTLLSPLYYTEDFGNTINKFNLPTISWVIPVNLDNKYKFVYLQNHLIVFLQGSAQKCCGLFEFDKEKNDWTDITPELNGNVITDIFPVDEYLYISTYEGLFRTKINPVSVQEKTEKTTLLPIELYPNPAIDEVNILNNYYTIDQITIYDMLGREVTKPFFTQDNFEIRGIKEGFYFVKLTFEGGWSVYKKIIKQ